MNKQLPDKSANQIAFLGLALIGILTLAADLCSQDMQHFLRPFLLPFAPTVSSIGPRLFLCWIVTAATVCLLPVKLEKLSPIICLAGLISISVAALFTNLWFYLHYSLKWHEVAIIVGPSEFSKHSLLHSHIFKALGAFAIENLGAARSLSQSDLGQPMLAILPSYAVGALLILFIPLPIAALSCIRQQRSLFQEDNGPAWRLLAIIGWFGCLKAVIDGGVLCELFLTSLPLVLATIVAKDQQFALRVLLSSYAAALIINTTLCVSVAPHQLLMRSAEILCMICAQSLAAILIGVQSTALKKLAISTILLISASALQTIGPWQFEIQGHNIEIPSGASVHAAAGSQFAIRSRCSACDIGLNGH